MNIRLDLFREVAARVGAVLLIVSLVIPSSGNFLKAEAAVGDYTISQDSGSPDISGLTVELFGSAQSIKAVGKCDDVDFGKNQQHVSVDWNEDMDSSTEDWEQLTDGSDWIFVCDGKGANATFTGTWSVFHTYPSGGNYTVSVLVHHGPPSGAEASESALVSIPVVIADPNTAPIVTLNGSSTMSVVVGGTFTDPGATGNDTEDGALTPVVTGSVDNSTEGTYTLTYTVTDSGGLTASVTRTVNVIPAVPGNTPPTVILTGSSTVSVAVGDTFTDPGATGNDTEDGALIPIVTGSVDTATVGTYTLTYTVTDSGSLSASTTRTVTVNTAGGGGGGGQDITITKTVDNETPDTNDTIVYTITVANAGPGTATNIIVTDLIPVGLTLTASSTATGSLSEAGGTITWDVGNLANGTTAELELTFLVTATSGTIVNSAVMTASNDSDDNDNTGTAPGVVVNGAVTYTLTVTYNGDGEGLITSADSTFYCDTTYGETQEESLPQVCEFTYASGTVVELIPTPNEGSNFDSSWSGACSGNGNCSVTMNGNKTANAHFAANTSGGSGGGGGSGSSGSSRRSSGSTGEVLGAFTDATVCSEYLHTFIRRGADNDIEDVMRLQTFLNEQYPDLNLAITGVYDDATFAGVNRFQVDQGTDVLQPWVNEGYHTSVSEPTGFVYLTTRRAINLIKCPTLGLAMPTLVPLFVSQAEAREGTNAVEVKNDADEGNPTETESIIPEAEADEDTLLIGSANETKQTAGVAEVADLIGGSALWVSAIILLALIGVVVYIIRRSRGNN